MQTLYQDRPGDPELIDRDADAVSSLLENALGEQLGSHGCVRTIAGEGDFRQAGQFGADDEAALDPGAVPSTLPGAPLSNYGLHSAAQEQAWATASAMQRASHLGQGMGGLPADYDFSGKVPTTFKTPKSGAPAGKTVTCAKCGRTRVVPASSGLLSGPQPLLASAGGAVLGGFLLGPLGALVGGGIGYFLGR